MFWNSSKEAREDDSGSKEERFIPNSFKDLGLTEKHFIIGKMFKNVGDPKKSKRRLYYVAIYNEKKSYNEACWKIISISYTRYLNEEVYNIKKNTKGYAPSFDKALEMIIQLENRLLLGVKVFSIDGMEGNYLKSANLHGGYFDKNGKYCSLRNKKLIKTAVSFRRYNLIEIYNNAGSLEEKRILNIATWDDLYKKIINKKPLKIKYNPLLKQIDIISERYIRLAKIDIERIKSFQGILIDDNKNLKEKKSAINSMIYHQIFYGEDLINNSKSDYKNFVLLSLIRTGAEIYKNILKDNSINKEKIESLKIVSNAIEFFAENYMAISKKESKELSKLIILGKDPYSYRLTAFEKSIKKVELLMDKHIKSSGSAVIKKPAIKK